MWEEHTVHVQDQDPERSKIGSEIGSVGSKRGLPLVALMLHPSATVPAPRSAALMRESSGGEDQIRGLGSQRQKYRRSARARRSKGRCGSARSEFHSNSVLVQRMRGDV
eukprot:2432819-Alexandrium_andersonii.AAC.1